jgi:DAK2 domain fusion protein YloV
VGILYCDGDRFRKALVASASWLSENSEILNRLNVFPVPDGDTGTNMSLTLISAVDELKELENAPLDEVLEAAARGSLMGARGCSGVIISQLIAGFAEVGRNKTRFLPQDIINGFNLGSKKTYQAVTEPKEGTILTVIRESAEEAAQAIQGRLDMIKLLERVLDKAKSSLQNTPKLLPVLAQAGVVDAGGQGFVFILEGIIRLVKGEPLTIHGKSESLEEGTAQKMVSESWDTPYCTEFILIPKSADISKIREDFAHLGNDLVVVGWGDMVRVHVHTSDPEKVLAYAHLYGKPNNVKIDDMKKQHRHITQGPILLDQNQQQDVSMIAIAPGNGIAAVFKSLGVESVLMSDHKNPSVSEMIREIDSAYSDKVLLLPNDGNVIPAAIQAANMSHKDIKIIPSRNISQGMSAVLSFRSDIDIEENAINMENSLQQAKNGEIARAVRNAQYGNVVIKENDAIGRFDGKIHVAVDDIDTAVLELLKIMVEPDNEVITFFYGADISRSEAEKVIEKAESLFPEMELELHYGGQTHCFYILSVE